MVDISQSRNRKSHKIIVHIYIYILYLVCGNKERREMFIDLWLEDFSSRVSYETQNGSHRGGSKSPLRPLPNRSLVSHNLCSSLSLSLSLSLSEMNEAMKKGREVVQGSQGVGYVGVN